MIFHIFTCNAFKSCYSTLRLLFTADKGTLYRGIVKFWGTHCSRKKVYTIMASSKQKTLPKCTCVERMGQIVLGNKRFTTTANLLWVLTTLILFNQHNPDINQITIVLNTNRVTPNVDFTCACNVLVVSAILVRDIGKKYFWYIVTVSLTPSPHKCKLL